MSKIHRVALSLVGFTTICLIMGCSSPGGSITGKVSFTTQPCSGSPDSCKIFQVALYGIPCPQGIVQNPCQPLCPCTFNQTIRCTGNCDTITVNYRDLPFGNYVVDVEQVDSLYASTAGAKGNKTLVGYYLDGRPAGDSTLTTRATVIALDKDHPRFDNFSMSIR
jgi:hypothetical protein